MKHLTSILIGLLLFTSCNHMLDVYPEDFLTPDQYFETEEQMNSALNGVYSVLARGALYGNYMQGRYGLDADLGYNNFASDAGTVSDYYVTPTDPKIRLYWRDLYIGVYRANLILENIDKPEMEETARNHIKGETLFLRAYFYFLLTIRFGDVPMILHTPQSPTGEVLQVPVSPAKDVYDKILMDMEEASELVRDVTEIAGGGRISKSAVWGMMARMCLYMAGNPVNETSRYADARKWAKMVMDVGHHELNPSFAQVFINYAQDQYDTTESIWEVEFWGNGTGLYGDVAGAVGIHNGIGTTQDQRYGFSRGLLRTTDWFYNLFDEDDTRRDFTISPYYFSGDPADVVFWNSTSIYNRFCGKYRREYETVTPKGSDNSAINFPLLRYADVLLMFAEADFHVNNNPTLEGAEALNQVRRRGYGVDINTAAPTIDIPHTDAVNFITELKDERARELAYENLRKDDLIRWGEFMPRMQFVWQHLDGMNRNNTALMNAYKYFGNASARDVLWPIPVTELMLNKELDQNPGW